MNKESKKILIVEDEVIVSLYLQFQLKRLNFNVLKPVSTGEKAISLAKEEDPDIILMDIRLASEMDGIQAVTEILSFSSPLVIFMTGYHDEKFRREAEKLNAQYLLKPIEISKLIETIEILI